ncbi:alpha/beta fold hydrolase [Nocardia sp. BMG51109]|uniref:alpha/beta fold hydrolase n=1 Tax=Nocardia sp. BMG51109 TaxID=1056816 RepID=UPI00046432D1|nr:alpha/beta fold hydrolase [Nocardia sp. BMG51109]
MSTALLIPGSFEGEWVYEEVAERLTRDGHQVFPLTLSGLEPDPARRPAGSANLDDHIADVVSFVTERDLDDLVLCAHSYGGMVLRGVCAALPERCRGAVYIDAFLPEPGESCWMLLNDSLRAGFGQLSAADGRALLPPPGADPRSAPHPVPSLLQASRAEAPAPWIRHAYIYAAGWRATPFAATYERLSRDPDWETYSVLEDHEIMRSNPELIADLLHKIMVNWN